MHWNKIALAMIGVFVLLAGLTSIASAERGSGADSTSAAAVTVTDPATVCATASATPGISTLCALWQGNTLPASAQQMIRSVIVRLAALGAGNNGNTDNDATTAARGGAGLCLRVLTGQAIDATANVVARCDNLEAGEMYRLCERASALSTTLPATLVARCAAVAPPTQQAPLERMTAKCRLFLAENPAATGERAAFCQRVITGVLTAADLTRIEQGQGGQQAKPRHPGANSQRGEATGGGTRSAALGAWANSGHRG